GAVRRRGDGDAVDGVVGRRPAEDAGRRVPGQQPDGRRRLNRVRPRVQVGKVVTAIRVGGDCHAYRLPGRVGAGQGERHVCQQGLVGLEVSIPVVVVVDDPAELTRDGRRRWLTWRRLARRRGLWAVGRG